MVYQIMVEHPTRGLVRTETENRAFAWRMVKVYRRWFPRLTIHVYRDNEPVYQDQPPLS